METATHSVLGHAIPSDAAGLPCLTAIFKLAGSPKGRDPYRYKTRKRVRCWVGDPNYWRAIRGRGTWAWIGLAIDYAEFVGLKPYVDPRVAEDGEPKQEEAAADQEETRSHAEESAAQIKARLDEARDLAEAARRFAEDLKEKTLRDLDEVRARAAREQEAREQGFESYREYDPDRPQDDDDKGIDHGDDWMDTDVAADKDTARSPWQGDVDRDDDPYGLDDLFFEFVNIPGFLRIRCSVN